jgi:hypothetical protein
MTGRFYDESLFLEFLVSLCVLAGIVLLLVGWYYHIIPRAVLS